MAVEIRQAEAQAETPAIEVSDEGAALVVEGVSVVLSTGAAVVLSTGAAVVVDAAEQVLDWRARTAVISAEPQVTMQGVTAFWKAEVQTQAVSSAEVHP